MCGCWNGEARRREFESLRFGMAGQLACLNSCFRRALAGGEAPGEDIALFCGATTCRGVKPLPRKPGSRSNPRLRWRGNCGGVGGST